MKSRVITSLLLCTLFVGALSLSTRIKHKNFRNSIFQAPAAAAPATGAAAAAAAPPVTGGPSAQAAMGSGVVGTATAAAVISAVASSLGNATAGGLVKSGWMKISSLDYINNKRFPRIPIPGTDGFQSVEIVDNAVTIASNGASSSSGFLDGAYFRKNDKYAAGGAIPSQDSFFFRLSGTNMYYTATQSRFGSGCFSVTNKENDEWDLCVDDMKEKITWVCAISKALGKSCDNPTPGPVIIEEKKTQKQPVMVIPLPSPYCNEKWNYFKGASDWNCKCSEGYRQSPIALKLSCTQPLPRSAEFTFIKFSPKQLEIVYEENLMRIRCRGQESCDGFAFAKLIDYNLTEYEAKEIRFHTPGEHTIDGKNFDLEIQVVFHPMTEGDYIKKAVLSFPIKQIAGGNNVFLSSLDYLNLPNVYTPKQNYPELSKGEGRLTEDPFLSLEDLFRPNAEESFLGYFNYFFYEGSLSSPPCDEHVRWFVVNEPIFSGISQVQMIREVLAIPTVQGLDGGNIADTRTAANPDGNARPVQDLNGRFVYYFDLTKANCMPKFTKPPKSEGHFERIEQKAFTYVYIPGDEPSGIQNSFVVSEIEAKGSPENNPDADPLNFT